MSEVTDFLDDPVLDLEAEAAAAEEWAERFGDKPLIIDLSARIPDGCLKKLLEIDPLFKETWFRQRSDLADQSQASYDEALACLGLGAGLTEQAVVDLIVHHRAQHRQKQRSKQDYFQRLISKAAWRTGGTDDLDKPTGPDPASPGPSSSEDDHASSAVPEPDEAERKAKLCKTLSVVLGAKIQNITKISGQSPIYHMDLADGRAAFPNVGKLISQTAVRNALAAITGKLMRKFKPKEWHKVSQALLDACTVEEGGEEMEMEGSARLSLDQYLAARGFISSIGGQSPDNFRKPMVAEGSITVCSSDIQTFINKTTSENVTIPMVVGMLHAVGAKIKRHRGKFREQSRWILPPDKFDSSNYLVPIPAEPPDETH
jgi:hypothetical protein